VPRDSNPARTLRTPNLERFARDGMRLTMAYSPSSLCGPSRAAIFGERNVGAGNFRSNFEIGDVEFIENDPLAADLKQYKGYKTAYFGKWGLGQTAGGPWNHGFDKFVGHLTHVEAHYCFPEYLTRYDSVTDAKPVTEKDMLALRSPIPANVGQVFTEANCPLDPKSPCTYTNDIFRNETLAYISQGRNLPFFVVWAPTYPHSGYYTVRSKGPYQSPVKRITPGRMTDGLNEFSRGHASEIEMHLDGDIGQLLDLLAMNPSLDRNTFIIFTSDNGPAKDFVGYTIGLFQSSGGLRGFKRSMFEGGLRVPTIVRYPALFPRGVVSNVPTALYDLGATIREVTGVPPKRISLPNNLATGAHSMLKVWSTNNGTLAPKRDWLYFELCPAVKYQDYNCDIAILDIRNFQSPSMPVYKIVVTNSRRTKLLFNLRGDPVEARPIRDKSQFQELWNWRTNIRYPVPS
jgi:arylsulfatase A